VPEADLACQLAGATTSRRQLAEQCRTSLRAGVLDVDRAFHGVDYAAELNEDAVAHELENPLAIAGERGRQDFVPARPQLRHGAASSSFMSRL